MSCNSSVEGGQDDPYITRETVSSAFAKLTCLCDEAPYLFQDSSEVLTACLQYIAVFTHTSLRQDPEMVALFVWFMNAKIERIVCKLLLESFLDSCIIEKWAEDIDDVMLQRFTHLTISLLLLETEIRAGHKDNPGYLSTQSLPLVFPVNLLIKILEKLHVMASQHVHTCIKYEKCVEIILLVHAQKPEVLRYLCNMITKPSTFRRDTVVAHATDYTCSWFQKLLKNPILTGQTTLVEELSIIKSDLVSILKAPYHKDIAQLILWINKLILCLNYFGDVYPSYLDYEDFQKVPSNIANRRESLPNLLVGSRLNSVQHNAFQPRQSAGKGRLHNLINSTYEGDHSIECTEEEYSLAQASPESEAEINPWENSRDNKECSIQPTPKNEVSPVSSESNYEGSPGNIEYSKESRTEQVGRTEHSKKHPLFAHNSNSVNASSMNKNQAYFDYPKKLLHKVSEVLNSSKIKLLIKRKK